MNGKKITVVIPTRERSDTLKSAIKTCLCQNYDNLEIIVSDNYSHDNTKEVVDSFKDSRIKYINTGKRISMSDNWEFALSHVNGEYIMFVGDDDGLLPNSLFELNEIINQTGCKAIAWQSAEYNWPNYINDSNRNLLSIPLRNSLLKYDSHQMLEATLNFKRHYTELPSLYKGLVSVDIIKKIIEDSGRFFYSMTPDIYSGIVLAATLDTYYYSFKPYTINGASGHSNGTSFFNSNSNKQATEKFLGEANLPFHHQLILIPSLAVIVAECFLQALDHVSFVKPFRIDLKIVLKIAMKEAMNYPKNQCQTIVHDIENMARLNKIQDYISQIIPDSYKYVHYKEIKPIPGLNIVRNKMLLDCTLFSVRNVYDASLLCHHFLLLRKYNYSSIKNAVKTNLKLLKKAAFKKGWLRGEKR